MSCLSRYETKRLTNAKVSRFLTASRSTKARYLAGSDLRLWFMTSGLLPIGQLLPSSCYESTASTIKVVADVPHSQFRNWLLDESRLIGSKSFDYGAFVGLSKVAHPGFSNELASVRSAYSAQVSFAYLINSLTLAKSRHTVTAFELILNFSGQKLTLAVLDPILRRNYFSLRPGLLIKYLEGRKKGAKRTLPTKLLLMRFLRKLLIISHIDALNIFVKGVPLHLAQLFSFLNRPLPHLFFDPVGGRTIDETGDDYAVFSHQSIFFTRSKPYGFQKTRKRGRVKRKIRRKIISSARVIDEL